MSSFFFSEIWAFVGNSIWKMKNKQLFCASNLSCTYWQKKNSDICTFLVTFWKTAVWLAGSNSREIPDNSYFAVNCILVQSYSLSITDFLFSRFIYQTYSHFRRRVFFYVSRGIFDFLVFEYIRSFARNSFQFCWEIFLFVYVSQGKPFRNVIFYSFTFYYFLMVKLGNYSTHTSNKYLRWLFWFLNLKLVDK